MDDPKYIIGQRVANTEQFGDVEVSDMFWSQHSKRWCYQVTTDDMKQDYLVIEGEL